MFSQSRGEKRCALIVLNGWEGITTDKQIAVLIEAARLAPSGSNKQPWDFLVIKSRELREKISAIDHDQKWMLQAEHMGLASCWTGWYDQREMRDLLGLDDRCYIILNPRRNLMNYLDTCLKKMPEAELELQ